MIDKYFADALGAHYPTCLPAHECHPNTQPGCFWGTDARGKIAVGAERATSKELLITIVRVSTDSDVIMALVL